MIEKWGGRVDFSLVDEAHVSTKTTHVSTKTMSPGGTMSYEVVGVPDAKWELGWEYRDGPDPGWTLNSPPRNNITHNKKDDFTMRITKTKMLEGWVVQTYLTINCTEHMVAESQYVEIDEYDPVADETENVVARLRSLLA